MKKKLFYSTRKLTGIYRIIVPACKFHHEKKNIVETVLFFQNYKSKILSLNVLSFILKTIVNTDYLSIKNIIKLKYKGISIGRHTLSMTFRNPRAYTNIFLQKFLILINLIKSYNLIYKSEKICKNISGAFIDHAENVNGVVLQVLLKKKIRIYQNVFPVGFFSFQSNSKKVLPYERLFQFKKTKRKISKDKKIKAINKLKNFSSSPKMPYILGTRYKKLFLKDTNFDYLVYCHSFTDAQLHFGIDGFYNQKDWLEYTLKELNRLKKKVLVKSHPNFYAKGYLADAAYYDKKIYDSITLKYNENKNIVFLNNPIKNFELLNFLDSKRTIIVGHHTTALLEALAFDFKCISSKSTFWDSSLKLTNLFSNRSNYLTLLKKDMVNLNKHNKNHLAEISFKLFFNKNGYFGENYIADFLASKLNIDRLRLTKNPDKAFKNANLNSKKLNKITEELSNFIQEINFS